MSFVEEQRKQIIAENNTAQDEFLTILEQLHPEATEIYVSEPLSGDIDCDILQKCNFTTITSLQFSPGNITSVKNIPAGLTKFVCAENYLVEVPEFPPSIVEIDLQKNAIRAAGGEWPASLKELNLCDNQIASLENLPAGLEVLRVDNNRMRHLSLESIENLRVLQCSNNPVLVVEHLPDTLQDVHMDNDVISEIRGEGSIEKYGSYVECLQTYFEMKSAYESSIHNTKKKIYISSKSRKEARAKISTIKPKCVYCSRPVGSIFKMEERTYIAKCGDENHPCAFHIELFAGEYGRIIDLLEGYQRTIELTKQAIIVDKMDVLFQYMSEKDGVAFFKDNLDYFSKQNVHYTTLKREYDALYFNEERNEKIGVKQKKLALLQERIAELRQKYRETNQPQLLRDAMAVYTTEVVPETNNLQWIKYDTREMIFNEREDSELYQKSWRTNQIEYTFGEYPKVVHFTTLRK